MMALMLKETRRTLMATLREMKRMVRVKEMEKGRKRRTRKRQIHRYKVGLS